MSSMLYVKDSHLNYIIVNKAFLNNLSLNESYKSTGKNDNDFFPAIEAKQNSLQDQEVLNTGVAIIDKEGFIPGTRKKKWGLISKMPIFDSIGKITGLIGTYVDITDRKKEEEKRKLLETALNNVNYTFWLLTASRDKTLLISRSVERVYGYPLEKFYHDKDFWLNNCLHPDSKVEYFRLRSENLWPKKIEYKIIDSSGKILWLEGVLNSEDYLGRNCIIGTIRDISVRKEHEDILKLLNKTPKSR